MHEVVAGAFDRDRATIPDGDVAGRDTPIRRALGRTVAYLHEQRVGDHWVGTLSSSALATAMSIVALRMVDARRHAGQIGAGRRWLTQTQHADGGWGDATIDLSNINATSLAIAALTFTAQGPDAADADVMERARRRLEGFGGWAAVGDPERCTLSGPCRTVAALAGLMDFHRIKRLRPEVIHLPWHMRRTISTTFPAYLSIAMLHSSRAAHPMNRLPSYRQARRKAISWLQRAQGADGSFEESAFLTSVIITGMIGSGEGALPWLPAAIRFVRDSQRDGGGWPIDRDLETFDTAMTVRALQEMGLRVPDGERVRAWLLARQFEASCFPTSAPPGGWAWAMPAGWPDSDDTSFTMLALRALGVQPTAAPMRRGAQWLEGMQNADGSWSTFVRNSAMPFDHDCPYITGHVLCALHAADRLAANPRTLDRALAYLTKAQRHDGSFASIWFREATAGTASVLEALADCGLLELPMASRARDALLRGQNDDGGWAGLRLQVSTAEETSWALLALLRCPPSEETKTALSRGIAWLIEHQRSDGTWAEAPIGLYYSAMWYSDSSYAVTLPMQALARAEARHARA